MNIISCINCYMDGDKYVDIGCMNIISCIN